MLGKIAALLKTPDVFAQLESFHKFLEEFIDHLNEYETESLDVETRDFLAAATEYQKFITVLRGT